MKLYCTQIFSFSSSCRHWLSIGASFLSLSHLFFGIMHDIAGENPQWDVKNHRNNHYKEKTCLGNKNHIRNIFGDIKKTCKFHMYWQLFTDHPGAFIITHDCK